MLLGHRSCSTVGDCAGRLMWRRRASDSECSSSTTAKPYSQRLRMSKAHWTPAAVRRRRSCCNNKSWGRRVARYGLRQSAIVKASTIYCSCLMRNKRCSGGESTCADTSVAVADLNRFVQGSPAAAGNLMDSKGRSCKAGSFKSLHFQATIRGLYEKNGA
jgi:hypothetical protein